MSYDADPDGRQWTRISSGSANSPRWQKTWQDWLGRQTRSERPAFTANPIQANYVETKAYDPATGRLTSSTATGVAPSLFIYDTLGRGQAERGMCELLTNGRRQRLGQTGSRIDP